MSDLQAPLTFDPIFMERIWGGRKLATLYSKDLPPGKQIGESWEIVDRAEAQSIVRDGPLAGRSLHDLWVNFRSEIFGKVREAPRPGSSPMPRLERSYTLVCRSQSHGRHSKRH